MIVVSSEGLSLQFLPSAGIILSGLFTKMRKFVDRRIPFLVL